MLPRSRTTPIDITKSRGQRYSSTIRRTDGVVVELDGGGYNRIGGRTDRVPHDIAHFVVEQHLGLTRGLWGVLASGGIVQNATFAAGRRPPHALRRAKAHTDRFGEQLRQAEVLVRAVADLALSGSPRDVDGFRRAVGPRWSTPTVTADRLQAACEALHDAAAHWQRMEPDEAMTLEWEE